jgi:hypothetical protein
VKFGIWNGTLLLLGLISSVPALASGINYDCAANLETTTCSYLHNTIAGLYAGVFAGASANIYIQYGSTGLGQSQQYYNSTSYNNYVSALTTQEKDQTDASAVASLPNTEPAAFGSDQVYLTSALSQALGISIAGFSGMGGLDTTLARCTLGTAGCYNGIITLATPASLAARSQAYYYRTGSQAGNAYDIYSVVEHETDEILGTISCISSVSNAPADVCGAANGVSAADLFRYSAAGTRSFVSQGNGTTAYFSVNGGNTSIAPYTNSVNQGDYGDWSSNCTHVQDASGCLGSSYDITSNGGVEITVLDAVGYTIAPEPGTLGMFGLGLLGVIRYRRRRK